MANQWIAAVKSSSQLTYHLADSVTGQWLRVINEAVRDFNRLAATHSLGVTFTPAADAASANLVIATGNGQQTYEFEGQHQTHIDGNALQGSTLLISRENSPIEKAFMFLPSQPMMYDVHARRRATGSGVMKMIALHELIHACGLSNADHTEQDVFNGNPSAVPDRNPEHDKIQITVNRQYRLMPPAVFSSVTARKVSRLWL